MITDEQKARIVDGLNAAFAIPLIDDVEDFVWEAIFCYAFEIPIVDPLNNTRSKSLFDVVDKTHRIGWSCKTLLVNSLAGKEFELVIQRADIFKKAESLGFNSLSKESDPRDLGKALLKHWDTKINEDAIKQGVDDRRIALLLKNKTRTKFAFIDQTIEQYKEEDLEWNWTDSLKDAMVENEAIEKDAMKGKVLQAGVVARETTGTKPAKTKGEKTGLQGIRKIDGFCVYRWYPNQKQFFERFKLPEETHSIELTPRRLALAEVVKMLKERLALPPKPSKSQAR